MAQDVSIWQEIALVASPALAALAAGASWASVVQARRLRKEEQEPELQVQIMSFPDGTIGAAVHNAGPGTARGVQVYLVHDDYFATGPIGHGFVLPGDTKIVRTPINENSHAEARAIISCRDRRSMPHAWDGHENHRVSKTWRGKPRYQTLPAIFESFYPDLPLDGLSRVPIAVTDERAEGSGQSNAEDGPRGANEERGA